MQSTDITPDPNQAAANSANAHEMTDADTVTLPATAEPANDGEAAPAMDPSPEPPADAPFAATDSLASNPTLDIALVKRVLEAALLSSSEPISTSELRRLFDNDIDADLIRKVLEELRHDWLTSSIELTAVATGWRFRVRPEFQKYLDRLNPEKPPRYSRAVMETLAIIAYRQPVTRADIEQIRGVTVSAQSLKALEDRGWIQVLGHLEKPGRPAIFGTTKTFLNDLNLRAVEELPPLEDLQAVLDQAPLQGQLTEPESPPSADADSPAAMESADTPNDATAGEPDRA